MFFCYQFQFEMMETCRISPAIPVIKLGQTWIGDGRRMAVIEGSFRTTFWYHLVDNKVYFPYRMGSSFLSIMR
ncbi:hypothetical protein GDO78_010692 [Eleutherodactylus coqui]|uniref:Uncharacterized protein n=1 Tax=Eleutherodactylus coqui TaxID=57060 RepID=A0A8J6F6G2_ELECQ|nr:hypothetical protein GDO78_010692 [Eleutherodactylus coqui]